MKTCTVKSYTVNARLEYSIMEDCRKLGATVTAMTNFTDGFNEKQCVIVAFTHAEEQAPPK